MNKSTKDESDSDFSSQSGESISDDEEEKKEHIQQNPKRKDTSGSKVSAKTQMLRAKFRRSNAVEKIELKSEVLDCNKENDDDI